MLRRDRKGSEEVGRGRGRAVGHCRGRHSLNQLGEVVLGDRIRMDGGEIRIALLCEVGLLVRWED